ncbi:hypothetical protein TPELB_10200 [Terrisporobacter petrolearius]|uniref:Glycosyl transferase family 1 domain-containing protein n=1 Tax=Terrisporobacter petrolearius TaxID=1460447 RepID=A0ABZ3FA96_9FIRM
MKVTFVINEPIRRASGGYKVVYEYANAFDNIGSKVQIVYRCKKDVLFSNYDIPWIIKMLLAKITAYKGPNWFNLNRTIKRKVVRDINDNTINNADVVIATAVDTAEKVNKLSESKGKKIYLIQGYETWVYPEEKVHETYSYDMTNIVVARWLKEKVDRYSNNNSICIPNGVNKDIYKVVNSIENRNRYSISMMYHNLESKGSSDGLKVLVNLKKKYPHLKAYLFGIPSKPIDLPEWIDYTCCATQDEVVDIYNKSSIYLCTSWSEGFGLTGAEAMMCGCALVSTETFGVKEYANKKTARLTLIRDVESLTKSCIDLMENNDARIQMSKLGQKQVTDLLNMERAKNKFIEVVSSERDNNGKIS